LLLRLLSLLLLLLRWRWLRLLFALT